MANTFYRKLGDGSWLNQGNPGSPAMFQVQVNTQDSLFYPFFTWNGEFWFRFTPAGGGFTTAALAQTSLDNYVAQLNAGTA